jgi:hypothetical protein
MPQLVIESSKLKLTKELATRESKTIYFTSAKIQPYS